MLNAKEICIGNAGKDSGPALPTSSVVYGTSLEHDRFDLPSATGSYLLFKHSRISKAAEMQFKTPSLQHGAMLWKERPGSLHERNEVQEITEHR